MALKWDNLDKKLDSIEGFIPKSVDNLEKGMGNVLQYFANSF